MLYFHALAHGLADLPRADARLRAELTAEAERHGWGALHQELAACDPGAAAMIHPNDPQRIQRALEVYRLTGEPLSRLRDRSVDPLPWRLLKLVVAPADRALLHRRIEARFGAMLEAGFLDEVRRLRARGDLDLDMPSMRAVGYRQAWRHLEGACDHDEMVRTAVVATRQLAKRQFTWLRRETGAEWLESTRPDLVDAALATVDRGLSCEGTDVPPGGPSVLD
jgi:tRNA dimethylallyltransferase